jgi:hypothetical protein
MLGSVLLLVDKGDFGAYRAMYCSTMGVLRQLIVEGTLSGLPGVVSTAMVNDSPGVSSIACPETPALTLDVSPPQERVISGATASEAIHRDSMMKKGLLPLFSAFAAACLVIGVFLTRKAIRDRESVSEGSRYGERSLRSDNRQFLRHGSMEVA